METLKAIFKRRSIRRYENKPLEREKLETILKAAMSSPTARNVQDWEFLVVESPAGRAKIMDNHPYAQMLDTAPVAVIVCSNLARERVAAPGYFGVNCAAAIQTMMISATDMGLGSVWLGVYPREERILAIKKAFNLPEDIVPVGIVVLGYGAESKEPEDRYDEGKVHFEQW